MTIITNPEHFRKNIRDELHNKLYTSDSSENIDSEHVICSNMEKGVYNYTIKEATRRKIIKKWENPVFVQLYVDKLRSIYVNLDQTNFRKQIQDGDVTPQNVAFMTHQEINPEQWKGWIDKKMKRDASKFNDNIQASTNMYTCKKCRSTRCTYYEMQTRSADEPATIFVTCLDCGKHWRA
jgi:transcription elongation factor S-II